jgi:hypothetical protein
MFFSEGSEGKTEGEKAIGPPESPRPVDSLMVRNDALAGQQM